MGILGQYGRVKISPFWVAFILFYFFSSLVNAQPSWTWARSAGTGSDQQGSAVTADLSGNVYVTGYIKGSGNNFGSISINSIGGDDIFIAKYDQNGTILWAKPAGGNGDDHGTSIAIDNAGNVYVCGYIDGNATFFGSPNITLTGPGNKDIFVAKYNSSGNVLWAKRAGSTGDGEGYGVCTNGTDVFITGEFGGIINFGVLPSLTASGAKDVCIASYNATTGIENWAIKGGSSANDEGDGIAVDATGIYVTGSYDNTCTFQNMTGSLTNNGGPDVFLVKYDLSGTGLWSRRAGGGQPDHETAVCTDGTFVYVAGNFSGTMSLYNSGPAVATITAAANADAFLVQYNASTGNYSWVRSENGTSNDKARGVAVNPAGDIFLTGVFTGTLPFGTGPSVTAANEDVFVTKYNSAGIFQWGKRGTGSAEDDGMGIAAPDNTSIYAAGYFKSSPAVFDAQSISTSSSFDIFIAKLGCTCTVADAGPDQTFCASSASLNGNVPVTGTGMWSLISGGGTITSPSSPSTTLSGLNAGPNVFQWTITNSVCPASTFDQVTITIDANPTLANAGPDQNVCSSSATLSGNAPTAGTGAWTLISGSGIPANPSSATTAVTGLSLGPNIFQWTISNGICPASSDQVTITVDPNPTIANAGPDQTICASSTFLSANIPSVGIGTWTLISGTGTISNPSSNISGVTALAPGANLFQWTITSGSCPSSIDQVMINVDANPTIANAGIDQTICSSSATLAGNAPAIGNGTWTLISGTGTITTPGLNSSTVTGLSVGVNVFRWTISNGTCPSSFDEVTINADENPTVANAGADQTVCSSSATLAGNAEVIGNGTWTLISGTGTITTPVLNSSAVTGLSVGANVFRWTISNGTCPSSFDEVIINVDANPTVANAGADQTLCDSSALLSGNIPTTGNGIWTLISGTGNIGTPASENSSVTNLSVGANIFRWTISNGTCPSTTDEVTINRDANPTIANAGADQTICSSAAILAGNIPVTGNGLWTLISGTGIITTPTLNSTAVTGLSIGVNVFRWTISNGTCTPSYDEVTINVDTNPSIANAGPDQTLCSSSATLAGNTPAIGNGTWTLISGTGNITTPSSGNSGVTGLAAGPSIFQWTISNGTCPSTTDQVIINVDANPTIANAGPDQTICSAVSIFAGNTPLTGNGVWNVVSSPGIISNPLQATSPVNNLATGINLFEWRITNGVCPSSQDTVAINVDAAPTIATAGPDQEICSSLSVLNGNLPATGIGMWLPVNTSAAIVNASLPNSSVTDLGTGVNSFEWVITNGVCPGSRDTINITVDENPSQAVAGVDELICDPLDTLHGNIPLVGSGAWYSINSPPVIGNPFSASTLVSSLVPGWNPFEWVISNGVCPATHDTISVLYTQRPSAPNAGADIYECAHDLILQAQVPSIGIGYWNNLSNAGTFSDTTNPNSSLNTIPDGAYLYTWTTANSYCVSLPDTITVTIYSPPTIAVAGADQLVHATSAFMNAVPCDTGIGTWTVISGSGQFENPNDPATKVIALANGINIFRWTTSNGVCAETFDDMQVESKALIIPTGYSPNSDGTNDNFEIDGLLEYSNVSFEVFNRWGNRVFISGNYRNDWNGTGESGEILPDDIYYFVLKLEDGTSFTGYVALKRRTI